MGFFSDLKQDLNQAVKKNSDGGKSASEKGKEPAREEDSTLAQLAELEEMLQDIDEKTAQRDSQSEEGNQDGIQFEGISVETMEDYEQMSLDLGNTASTFSENVQTPDPVQTIEPIRPPKPLRAAKPEQISETLKAEEDLIAERSEKKGIDFIPENIKAAKEDTLKMSQIKEEAPVQENETEPAPSFTAAGRQETEPALSFTAVGKQETEPAPSFTAAGRQESEPALSFTAVGRQESESALGFTAAGNMELQAAEEEIAIEETTKEIQDAMEAIHGKLESIVGESERSVGNVQPDREIRASFGEDVGEKTIEEYLQEEAIRTGGEVIDKSWVLDLKNMDKMDETAVITAGMRVKGDILSNGSIDIFGEVQGNVQVSGKLNVTGRLNGNSKAAEVFVDSAKINGDIISDGEIKIGAGTVVVGNIEATGAMIAGAVKGTIDVHGPVILDTTAVVLGNVRAKSMQINNGARIEGMCVLCYAEQSAARFFEEQEEL